MQFGALGRVACLVGLLGRNGFCRLLGGRFPPAKSIRQAAPAPKGVNREHSSPGNAAIHVLVKDPSAPAHVASGTLHWCALHEDHYV